MMQGNYPGNPPGKTHPFRNAFLGKDVVGHKERQFLENLSYKIELIIKEAEAEYYKENTDETQRGFHLYHRAKYQQKCEHISCSNNYFTHPNKDKCEKNVIEWIESLEIN